MPTFANDRYLASNLTPDTHAIEFKFSSAPKVADQIRYFVQALNRGFAMQYKTADQNTASTWGEMASRLLVATPDNAHPDMDKGIREILTMLRSELHMDAVFVSEFSNGRCVFRHVDVSPERPVIVAGHSVSLEESLC